MNKKAFSTLVGSICILLLCTQGSIGQDLSGTGLTVTGTGAIHVLVSDTATVGQLMVTGTADLQSNTLLFGISGTNPGISLVYSDGNGGVNSSFGLISTHPATSWLWQRMAAPGAPAVTAMQLDGSNRLILNGIAAGSMQQLILDPNQGVSLNGSNLLSRTDADLLYLPSTMGLYSAGGKIGIGTTAPNAQLQVNASSGTTVGAMIQGAPSQTADLTQWVNASGSILAKVNNAGTGYFGMGSSYPAIIGDHTNKSNISMKHPSSPFSARLNQRSNGETVFSANVNDSDQLDNSSYPAFKFTLHMQYDRFQLQYSPRASGQGWGGWDTHEAFSISLSDGRTNFVSGVSVASNEYPSHQFEVGSSSEYWDIDWDTWEWIYIQQNLSAWIDQGQAYFAGSVGIGTESPEAELDVNGNVKIAENAQISGHLYVSGGFTATGTSVTVTSGTTTITKIVALESNQLVLIPEQGNLSMGAFTEGAQPLAANGAMMTQGGLQQGSSGQNGAGLKSGQQSGMGGSMTTGTSGTAAY